MVRKVIAKAKRVYHRGKGFLGRSNMFNINNPYIIGGIMGAAKNVINGQPAINIKGIQSRITQPNAKNPLVPLALGVMFHNTALKAIGTYLLVDPPVDEENDDITQEEIDEMADGIIAEEGGEEGGEGGEEGEEEEEEEEENNKQIYIHK